MQDIQQEVVSLPRSYQTELMEQAKLENLVICLPTGSGKTYIAVMLIKEMAHETRRSIDDGGKRTIFLVKTVALVQQQSEYIRIHTDLKVGKYYGELKVDLWDKERWINEFEQHQVLVFTAKVFLDLVDHNYFPLYKVNLLIFDECHHSTGENCYASLMRRHYDTCHDQPRILGLTASISAKKLKLSQLETTAKQIEETYRARLASGSDREESARCGTSACVEHIRCFSYKEYIKTSYESITIAFDTIQSILLDLEPYVKAKKAERERIAHDLSEVMLTEDYLGENVTQYNNLSVDYTIFLQSEYVNIPRLKRYLEQLIHVGYELGLYGLFLATKSLQKALKSSQALDLISDAQGKQLFDDSLQRIDCLVDDILQGLIDINQGNDGVLFSSKVLNLFQRINTDVDKNSLVRCIVFVERIYTATVLTQILIGLMNKMLPLNNNHFKIKYLTGPRANIGDAKMTAKYLQQVIKEFRTGQVNVLVATAVVEEGLDIPKCNLVFRFNKPPNFSSYMQSKGRARAKQNASYVLLIDESDEQKDITDYGTYEDIEKKIRDGFSIDNDDDFNTDDSNQLEPYRTENGAVISAVRAAQIIFEYCAVLGNGRICPPRILFSKTARDTFTSILSMPANCPVLADIICENRKKKLAKFQCCLKMVELLHQQGELNDHCLPHHRRLLVINDIPIKNRLFKLCDELFEKKNDSTMEKFPKQIASFPPSTTDSSNIWYLYRISIRSEKDKFGFIVPTKLIELANFNLYAASNEILTVDVAYVKTIDYAKHRHELERFCRFLFENVLDEITHSSDSILKFDIEHSSFKCLPCLLKDTDEIDDERMLSICNRLNKPVEDYSQLSDDELYTAQHLSQKLFYMKMPNGCSSKRTSDPWEHKKKIETIKTYADYFQEKVPDVNIHRDALMVEVKGISKPRINYLYSSPSDKKNDSTSTSSNQPSVYYPIELLHYAPFNIADMQFFHKLPSILVRITQLYYIEQLRTLFATHVKNYSLMDVSLMRTSVSFTDCLKTMNSTSMECLPILPQTILPLIPLTYDSSIAMNQPMPDILFQAIARRSCGEQVDHENLEILGDCFLKLAVSMSLYIKYPSAGAGVLTNKKKIEISNENLYRLTIQNKLKAYLNVKKIAFRGTEANWLPPGYTVDKTKPVTHEQYTHQNAKRKAFSDMIEAFIGTFLISSDYTTTLKFMHWLGLDVIPLDGQGNLIKLPSIFRASTVTMTNDQMDRIINQFFTDRAFADIETKINYTFQNKAYLIAAFTHPSNFANRATDCYERLEFLGDAILDFLVTRHIFVNYSQKITPGRVTDIRQDLSNNGRLAYILVACGLHTKILHNSTTLFGHITSYAGDENLFPENHSTVQYLSKDLDQWADTTAPKALADVFEALVGAVFLDSGNSLQTVWNVFEPLLRNYIDRSIICPNLNPVRWLSENGGKVTDEFPEITDDGPMAVCVVQMSNGTDFEGRGTNKNKAKFDACRKAMKQSVGQQTS
ncbi:unnamed protein product [Adineta steineri]|uniref:Uncharacterized protein n=1 Tax=Adineta steineri TaxID=433720 RepID=A0A815VCC6_9BILA|nr:unnamed protein product [Adineta steineri]CAF1528283.1 unnamed protein product [Adineta steineri]